MPFQAHVWNPQSFNPNTGLFYVTVRNATYGMVAEAGAKMGNQLLSINVAKQPEGAAAAGAGDSSLAVGVESSHADRSLARRRAAAAGTMTTAGNLVFQSEGQNLVAYRADNGEKLWDGRPGRWQCRLRRRSPTRSMACSTSRPWQVAVAWWSSSSAAMPRCRRPPRLRRRRCSIRRRNFGTEAQLATGTGQYTAELLHLPRRPGAQHAPAPRICATRRSWRAMRCFSSVVIDGIKTDGGMKSFKGGLSPEDVEAIRAHLVQPCQRPEGQSAAGPRRIWWLRRSRAVAGGGPPRWWSGRSGWRRCRRSRAQEPQVGLHQ